MSVVFLIGADFPKTVSKTWFETTYFFYITNVLQTITDDPVDQEV